MAKYFIKSISIEGFRGINNQGSPLLINFQSDGVTSIFGENGKGKSSIYESFLFSILGRIVRFDDYHGDIKDKGTIKNIFHSTDGGIKIEFIDNSNTVTDIKVNINSTGERSITSTSISNPELFLATLCSSLNFLDYKSFEKIMLTSSEETGKLFSNLVGFGNFIKIKDKLDKISRTQNINTDFGKSLKETVIKTNDQKISDTLIDIQKRFKEINIDKQINKANDTFNYIKSFLKKQYSVSLKGSIYKSTIDFDQLVKAKIGSAYESNVSKLNTQETLFNDISKLFKNISNLKQIRINSLMSKLKAAYSELTTEDDIVLGKLFDDAIKSYDVVSGFDKNTCILCQSENLGSTKGSFYQQISTKVISYNKFKEKYASFLSEFSFVIQTFSISEIESRYLIQTDRLFTNIEKSRDYLKSDFFENINIKDIVSNYKEKVKNELNEIKEVIINLKALIPPKISELVDLNNVYKFVFNSIVGINALIKDNEYNKKYLTELEKWITFAGKIKEQYEDAYNDLMDEIASMIDTDTKIFFKEIMGNVDIIPKITKEHKGQKVNILLEKFYNNDTDIKAATLLSESYRNALCLSIYFATALKSKNSGNFIVVDDITSSFDSGHQLYLLDLIKRKISISPTNKKGKQIIFLTHDGLLKKTLNVNSELKNWTHYNLNSNKDNVSLKPFKSDDLKAILNTKINDGNYLGSDFRMYYEFVLVEIIENLNLEIPFSLISSNDEKMVNKLSNAIHEIIELKRKAGKLRAVGSRLPNKSDFKLSTQQLSNNLSHWASGGKASLGIGVLNRIIDDIDNFKRMFQYNCICASKNAGWVYFKSLNSPKHNGCTCII